MSENHESLTESKILIMGLDNAGKSSILLSLKGKKNLMEYVNIKPTKRVNINRIAKKKEKFIIWDFGGQKAYREKYIQNLNKGSNKYFNRMEKLIYVIDVQDVERYEEALKYFEAIMKHLVKTTSDVKISIFLHKFDPGIEKDDQYSISTLDTLLIKPMERIMPEKIEYDIFKTTIFTIFQKSMLF